MKEYINMEHTVQEIELPTLKSEPVNGAAGVGLGLPFLNSVKVKVSVRVGETETTVGTLLDMKQGEVLALDRTVEQPVDIMVDGHVVARGMLVAVGDYFGVRLTEPPASAATTGKP